ncbi:hypothetical protein ACFYPC_30875 [Streptomyces sp. NPDC005808]|uniref:hypothetical protein n=1 Tax=Streptomyces sp. NPDC005808 TaxID=3364734 RepID=UPI0036BC953C
MMNRGTLLTAAGVLIAAVPVAAWGLMGQQNSTELPTSQLDYAFEPLGIPDGTATVLGATALVLAGACAALLVRASRSGGGLDKRWWGVLAPLVMAGLLAGTGWRILTAGVIGANIGAGLVVFFMVPAVAGLVMWALGRGVWLATRRPTGGQWSGFAPRGA